MFHWLFCLLNGEILENWTNVVEILGSYMWNGTASDWGFICNKKTSRKGGPGAFENNVEVIKMHLNVIIMVEEMHLNVIIMVEELRFEFRDFMIYSIFEE